MGFKQLLIPEGAPDPRWTLSPTLWFSPSLYPTPSGGKNRELLSLCICMQEGRQILRSPSWRNTIFPFTPIFLLPRYLHPSSFLTTSPEREKTDRKKRKERNMLPGLEKSSFPRSSVIMLMEGRTGKRKCFANVENFWPGFFLRPVCQGEKEIGGWMKYELMQLQCL